ncbi:histidinol-phosphatase [Thiomicrorhabdus lithotrophica]|uniref:HAD-IB family hydrolase n=1 Tax=Thiomicrorhabdus lithotrophica TaxID=2949997 RepID=A0ABY8C6S5_9GAMM|nr:HAD family hydrolase [Thiomicrorhabdus lithotrophica]WEJ61674.1 HAD-IB family hydrolase [Thiomicrorhabdus lithotrophica]
MALAIFDLDNTLIGNDSDYLWGEFLVQMGYVNADEFAAQNAQFYEDYKSGCLDIMAYQRFALKPLSEQSMETLNKWHAQFMEKFIEPIILPKAQALVDEHKAKGDRVIIITATNTFITRRIGLRYGIAELLGTNGEIVNNRYTGEVAGIPTFQEGKVTRLNEWLAKENETLEGSYFYSDSFNDLPLLEIVDHPIVVDGDDKLLAIAKEKNWPSISFR